MYRRLVFDHRGCVGPRHFVTWSIRRITGLPCWPGAPHVPERSRTVSPWHGPCWPRAPMVRRRLLIGWLALLAAACSPEPIRPPAAALSAPAVAPSASSALPLADGPPIAP